MLSEGLRTAASKLTSRLTDFESNLFSCLIECQELLGQEITLRVLSGWVRDKLLCRKRTFERISVWVEGVELMKFAKILLSKLEIYVQRPLPWMISLFNSECYKIASGESIIKLKKLDSDIYMSSVLDLEFKVKIPLPWISVNLLAFNIQTKDLEDWSEGIGLQDLNKGLASIIDQKIDQLKNISLLLSFIHYISKYGLCLSPNTKNYIEANVSILIEALPQSYLWRQWNELLHHNNGFETNANTVDRLIDINVISCLFRVPGPHSAIELNGFWNKTKILCNSWKLIFGEEAEAASINAFYLFTTLLLATLLSKTQGQDNNQPYADILNHLCKLRKDHKTITQMILSVNYFMNVCKTKYLDIKDACWSLYRAELMIKEIILATSALIGNDRTEFCDIYNYLITKCYENKIIDIATTTLTAQEAKSLSKDFSKTIEEVYEAELEIKLEENVTDREGLKNLLYQKFRPSVKNLKPMNQNLFNLDINDLDCQLAALEEIISIIKNQIPELGQYSGRLNANGDIPNLKQDINRIREKFAQINRYNPDFAFPILNLIFNILPLLKPSIVQRCKKLINEKFLKLYPNSKIDIRESIKRGIHLNMHVSIELSDGKTIYYFVKSHHSGPVWQSTSSVICSEIVDLKELFLYKLLEKLGFGPECCYIGNDPKEVFIATRDLRFNEDGSRINFLTGNELELQFEKDLEFLKSNNTYIEAIITADLIQWFFDVSDILGNSGNYGFTLEDGQLKDFKIFDLSPPKGDPQDYTKSYRKPLYHVPRYVRHYSNIIIEIIDRSDRFLIAMNVFNKLDRLTESKTFFTQCVDEALELTRTNCLGIFKGGSFNDINQVDEVKKLQDNLAADYQKINEEKDLENYASAVKTIYEKLKEDIINDPNFY